MVKSLFSQLSSVKFARLLKMADVTDAIKIMGTHRNDSISDIKKFGERTIQ